MSRPIPEISLNVGDIKYKKMHRQAKKKDNQGGFRFISGPDHTAYLQRSQSVPTQNKALVAAQNNAQVSQITQMQNNAKGQGRVRVSQGDKCVAPVKSKPKKRRNLLQGQSGLSMDSVVWSDTSYNVRELVQHQGSKFPILCMITQGYDSDDLDFSTGQVIQVQSFGEQDRIRARDSSGRTLSISLEYPAEVTVPSQNSSECRRLEQAIRKFPMPVELEVVSVAEDASLGAVNIAGEKITAIEGYEDLFLKANSINDGWIDQTLISILPSFLDVRMSVAVGMAGATEDEWKDYQNMFAWSVRHLSFKKITGYQGVVILENDMARSPDVISQLKFQTTSKRQRYENVRVVSPGEAADIIPSPSFMSLPTTQRQGDNIYQNLGTAIRKEHRAEYDNFAMFPHPQASPVLMKSKTRSNAPGAVRYENVQLQNLQSNAMQTEVSDSVYVDDVDVTEMFDNVLKVASNEDKTRQQADTTKQEVNVRNLVTKFNSPPQKRKDLSHIHNSSVHVHASASPSPKPAHAPKAIVQPTVQPVQKDAPCIVSISIGSPSKINNNNNASPSKVGSSGALRYGSIENIPPQTDVLTVEDICECLKLLNMENHINTFRRHQVDGPTLTGLRESVLQNEFGMTPFNASKLMRFARGWRPKIN